MEPYPSRHPRYLQIFQHCGTPTEQRWPGVSSLPLYYTTRKDALHPNRLSQTFRRFVPLGIRPDLKSISFSLGPTASDLLCKLLTLDPSSRISAQAALDHDWFWKDPMPCDPKRCKSHSPPPLLAAVHLHHAVPVLAATRSLLPIFKLLTFAPSCASQAG